MKKNILNTKKSNQLNFRRNLSFKIFVPIMIVLLLNIIFFGTYLSSASREKSKKLIIDDILVPKFISLSEEKDSDFESINELTEYTAQKIEAKIQESKNRTNEDVNELFGRYLSKKPDGSYRSNLNESKGRFQMAAFHNNKSEPDIREKNIFIDAFLFFDPFSDSLSPYIYTTYFATPNSIWQYGFPDWALTSSANESFEKYGWFYEADPIHNPNKDHIWTDMYYDALQKQWMISSLMPIYDGDEFLGIIGQDLILDKIVEITKKSTLDKTGILFFIDNLDNIVAHPDTEYLIGENVKNDEKLNLTTLSDIPLTTALKSTNTMDQGYVLTEEKNKRIVMWFPLKSVSWKMIYAVNENELLLVADQTNIQYIFIFIFFSILILVFVIFLMKFKVITPIKKLTEGVNEITEGNFNKKIEILSNDEIGILADSFNQMRQHLKQSREDLLESQKNLEKKVDERTLELNEKIIKLGESETATLNIMEDLQQTIDKLKETQTTIELQNIQLKKLDKIKSDFLNITSHELRTPMSAIKGYIQMIMKQSLGGITEEQKQALNVIMRNTNRLDNLIQDILDISRLESGTMKFISEPTNLQQMVNEVIETTHLLAETKMIQLYAEVEQNLPDVVIDKERIKQVIMNLVNNAIKFSPNGSAVILRVKKDANNILCEVQDHGRGVPKEYQNKIFDTFYQVDSGMDRKFGGAGLGLSIARGIVLSHGGNIWVESTGIPGEGSSFKFILPLIPVHDLEGKFREADIFRLKDMKKSIENDLRNKTVI